VKWGACVRNFVIEICRERDSKWWRVDVPTITHPALDGSPLPLRTQALFRKETVPMAQDVIATWLDVPLGSIHIGQVIYRYRPLH
jgi:hypothetical protein